MSSTRKRRTRKRTTGRGDEDEEELPLIKFGEDANPEEVEYHYSWDKTKQVPWKAIILAIFLFVVGSVLLAIGILIVTDVIHFDDENRGIPFIVLGSICFIPGSFYVYITYQIYKGNPKYSYLDFPEM